LIELLVNGNVSQDLNDIRNELRCLVMEVPLNEWMRKFSEKFVELRYMQVKDLLQHRILPYPICPNTKVSSDVLGPLVVGKIDISEYEGDNLLNIRELKRMKNEFADRLQVANYGILKSAITLRYRRPEIRTFLDYVPYGPMGNQVDFEDWRPQSRRLAKAVVEMIKKPKHEVEKMDVNK